jgi:hypothetical protein
MRFTSIYAISECEFDFNLWRVVLDKTLCNKVCPKFPTVWLGFFQGLLPEYNITEVLLKMT